MVIFQSHSRSADKNFEEHGRTILCLLRLFAVYMVLIDMVNEYITFCENPKTANI